MNISINDSSRPPRMGTARKWELAHGQSAVDWMHASGIAGHLLDEICAAIEKTIEWTIAGVSERARAVLEQYPEVLSHCDNLDFEDPAQALAYLFVHLPDRYVRTFQVLEQLLITGALPVGKSENFAAIDIGAGPGPASHAIRSFYAILSRYAKLNSPPSLSIMPLRHLDIVERSEGMAWAMHTFSEALVAVQHSAEHAPKPWIDDLERSRLPFGTTHKDFEALDIKEEHNYARNQAIELENIDDDDYGIYRFIPWRPSAYALIVMMNFLTTPDAVPLFSESIDKLMRSSLVPGGIILVLGATSKQYREIYQDLDERATEAGLSVLSGFEKPLEAGARSADLAVLRRLTRGTWQALEALAGDVSEIKDVLRDLGAADIFDESVNFRLPRFTVRAYRRGKWPTEA